MSNLPEPLITVSPEYLSGAPVFTGTRVPVQALFDYIEGGDPLDEFLDDFPDVSREHAIAVLELARARGGGAIEQGRCRVTRRWAHAPPAGCMRASQVEGALAPHTTSTARERGWKRLADVALLDAMAGEIDALITVDRGLPFQQRLHDRPFGVAVLRATTNRLEDLLPLVPALLQVLNEVKPGEVREITE